jgi:hypothetical protein
LVYLPLAIIVTPDSMDHIEFLGDTMEKIAAEKAGIFRNGVPAVIAPQTAAAAAVLERLAEKARAPLHVAGQHWHANVENGRLVYSDEQGLFDLPPPKLFGRHQFDNAGTAIAALRAAGVRVPIKAVEQGLMRAEWPARLQRLTAGKLVALAPAGAEIWLDGGHNADGGRAVAAALGDLEERVSRPLVLVVGMLANKDRDGFLRNFTGLVRRVYGVRVHQDKGAPAGEIAAAAQSAGMPADAADSIEDALAAIGRLGFDPPPRILITGSLYLAGEVLAANGTAPVSGGEITPRKENPPVNANGRLSSRPSVKKIVSAGSGCGRRGDPLLQLLLRRGADLARCEFAVLEQHQGRDRHDAVFRRRCRVPVHVELHDLHPAVHRAGDLVERGRDLLARAAPLGPEVDHHRLIALQHLGVEIRVGNL